MTGSAGFGAGRPERHCATGRRQRDRVRARSDHQPGQWRAIAPARKRRLHRGQSGAREEQRADGARFDWRGASFSLENKAAVSTTGALANNGYLYLEANPGDGGSSLTVAEDADQQRQSRHRQRLTLGVGRGDGGVARQYRQNPTDRLRRQPGAPRRGRHRGIRRRGNLERTSVSGDSAIEFKSGQITSLAANAQLHLGGNDAFIEDSGALGSNSALKGLASIGAGATFGLHNKAAVSTSGALANATDTSVGSTSRSRGDGGSSLTVGGR